MFSVVIVAAGSGARTGLGYNKIFYRIKNKTLIEYSVAPFLSDEDVKEIVIVLSKEDMQEVRALFSHAKIKYVIGGSTRQKSVFNGLSLIGEKYVLIHDSARPNIQKEDIEHVKSSVLEYQAAVLYTPVKDSVVEYSGGQINQYLDRNRVGLILTPQAFNSELIKKAHSLAIKDKNDYKDDAELFSKELNLPVALVEGNEHNIKATTKLDLDLLEELL
ncbi:MAG TPA: 2-C-methyl-D-erythritol 4-phosphate cytidylyltransferase [Bacillota bacterium]|nr:2-C-methyl-D-erythritol 4-phosphate cytidylyltransferase [Bacillota bacterium]HPJ23396.1 2-C-methyl-D-erythritol 4-phosphate cytidylyltransferase [Bacillota bacterium]